jgi:type IV pilus assembly protein PilA
MPTWAIVLLVVAGLTVSLGGIVAVLAIYGVRKYLAAAKQAEARNSIGMIAKDAAAQYELSSTTGAASGRSLCASASSSVPGSAAMIRGYKYQSDPADWEVDAPRHAGFACLRFSMDTPQYYMYSYRASGTGKPGDSFTATANGDLNGDGVLSTFTLTGQVGPTGDLSIAPTLHETNPDE